MPTERAVLPKSKSDAWTTDAVRAITLTRNKTLRTPMFSLLMLSVAARPAALRRCFSKAEPTFIDEPRRANWPGAPEY